MSFKVIGIGEVLWDLLPAGAQLGGAPANFACHARRLGADAQVITRIGNDAFGRRALLRFGEMDISAGTVQVDDLLPTGTARVALDENGTPRFVINDGAAWDALTLTGEALDAVGGANAVCFGTLAQRTAVAAAAIQGLVSATPVTALRVFDINLRQGFYSRKIIEQSLGLANVLKLNDDELAMLSSMFGLAGAANQRIVQLAEQFDLQLVALTRAERGSLLYRSGNWSELPGRPVNIVDTVGAGDAFTAALVMGLLHQFALDDVHLNAANIADFVCSRRGATPSLPLSLCAAFRENSRAV